MQDRESPPGLVGCDQRPKTGSITRLARSAVRFNVGSITAIRRSSASVVWHWVVAFPVSFNRRRLPPPEDFPEGIVALGHHRLRQVRRGGPVLPLGHVSPLWRWCMG